jgi:dynein heavy chain
MMLPDMAMIAEIMLFSEGFVMAKVLSKKMTGLFDLMKEQMSKQANVQLSQTSSTYWLSIGNILGPLTFEKLQQDHYDYGLRNTKSILVAAGALKRAEPNMQEDILLYRTIRDMQAQFVKSAL